MKVKAKKISLHFGTCKKLVPRFCGPFEIMSRIDPMAYELTLPPTIKIHNFFHLFLFKNYVHDNTHVLNWYLIQVDLEGEIQIHPDCILQQRTKMLKNRTIEQVKVQRYHYGPEEATWELDEEMRKEYPQLL